MKRFILAALMLLATSARADQCKDIAEKWIASNEKAGLVPESYEMLDPLTAVFVMKSDDGRSSAFVLTQNSATADAIKQQEKTVLEEKGDCTYEGQLFQYYILSRDDAVQVEDKPIRVEGSKEVSERR